MAKGDTTLFDVLMYLEQLLGADRGVLEIWLSSEATWVYHRYVNDDEIPRNHTFYIHFRCPEYLVSKWYE